MTKKFPKVLYVKFADGGSGPDYLQPDDSMAGLVEMGEKIKIASYKLVGVQDAEGVVELGKAKLARQTNK